jgi:hypothetical protein
MRGLSELVWIACAGAVPNLAYAGLGLAILRRLGIAVRGAEAVALGFVLGTGAASLAILVLRLLGVPIPLWSVAAVAAAALPAWRGLAPAPPQRAPRDAAWVRAVDAASIGFGALTFASALGPETFWDGFEYHLPMVVAWSEGPIRALPGLIDAELRAGVDLLFLPAVAAGAPDAAAGVSACFAACLAVLIRAEARRRATPGAASLAALFSLIVPFTLDNAPSSYVDLGVGAYGFVALQAADRWSRRGDARDLALSAAAIAFAANAKLHALALAPAVLALVLAGGRPPAPRMLVRSAALVLALIAPWFVKTWLAMGNPVFPLLVDWLGSGWASADHLALRRYRLSTDFAPRGPWSFAHYLVSMHFGGNPHVSGLLGALPLALLPAAIHRPSRPTALLAATLFLLLGLQFVFMPAVRFGAPLLPWLAIGAAVGGARLARSGRGPRLAVGAALVLLGIHHGVAALARHLPRVAAIRSPDAYRASVFLDQIALGQLVAQGRGVVAIPGGAVLWMRKPVYLLHWERNGELFFGSVLGRRTPPDEALALLRRRGVGSLVVEVPAPLPDDRVRVGHPTVDAWIAAGQAARRLGVRPRPVRPGRLLVLVDLLEPASAAGPDPLERRLEAPQAVGEQRRPEADPPDAE